MFRSTPAHHLRARMTAIAVAVAVILTGLTIVAAPVAETANATVPGTPGTTQAGTPVYSENFSNQTATAPISILNYTGSAGTTGADSETYTADAPYTPAGGQCDGWIMNSTTTAPTALQDVGCANNSPGDWQELGAMATDLGTFQGQANPTTNQDLTEYTNSPTGLITPGYELETAKAIPATAGHYYAVSADFAEVNCFAAQASETFSLVEGATPATPTSTTPVTLSSGLDPCTAPGAINYDGTEVASLQSAALELPAGDSILGLELYNATTTGSGNDVAFDLPQIVDVTPQLDKSFTPSTITLGQTSTVTLTVTNTSDLDAKPNWTISDALPAGLTVANTTAGGTCGAITTTLVTGGKTAAFTGGLTQGEKSCTITFTVTPSATGTYTNGPGNITTNLNPPANATLTVLGASVQVNKTWIIKNAAGTVVGTYNVPSQGTDTATSLPAGFSAAPTLTGQTSPSFGTAYTGYAVGQSVTVGEVTVTIPAGCAVASQKMTSVNGAILTAAASLPYAGTVAATPTPNTFTITNTITCTQTLTLVKKVAYGSLPATDWTLKGTGPSGSLSGPSGVTGSAGATTVSVTPQVSYALAESSAAAGSQNYVPTAAGWVCVAGSTSIPVSSASVVVGYGQAVTCTITNTTAEITVLKHIQGTGGLTSGQFNLTITPPSGLGSASTFAGSETAATANTFEVQPGAAYTVAEQALSSSTAYLSLGLQVSTDGGNTWTTVSGTQVSAAAGAQVFYRFVNESVPVIALPLTGGLGTDVIAYWALALLGAAAALIAVQLYRRRKASRR